MRARIGRSGSVLAMAVCVSGGCAYRLCETVPRGEAAIGGNYSQCIPRAPGNSAAMCEAMFGVAFRAAGKQRAIEDCINLHGVSCFRDKCPRECVNTAIVSYGSAMILDRADPACPGLDSCFLNDEIYDCTCSCPPPPPVDASLESVTLVLAEAPEATCLQRPQRGNRAIAVGK